MSGKRIFATIVGVVSILFFVTSTNARVIFSENCDSQPDWNCSQAPPVGWSSNSACSSDTYNGVFHYGGEITSQGRGGTGKSLKQWRHNGWSYEYNGYSNYYFSPTEFYNHHKQISSRYYIRFDPGFDTNDAGGMKANRYFIDSVYATDSQGHSYAFMVNIGQIASKLSNSAINVGNSAYGSIYYSEKTVTGYNLLDGNWHCFEVLLKMNSDIGVKDGEFHCWIDGVEISLAAGGYPPFTVGLRNIDWGYPANTYITKALDPGIGNLSIAGGAWNFPTNGWYKVEFDDYVVSTTYIGPGVLSTSYTTPPNPPQGVRILQ